MHFLMVSCLYKPPAGKNILCIEFIKQMYTDNRRDIWLLGDFNVDYLDRTSDYRLNYLNVFKNIGPNWSN